MDGNIFNIKGRRIASVIGAAIFDLAEKRRYSSMSRRRSGPRPCRLRYLSERPMVEPPKVVAAHDKANSISQLLPARRSGTAD
jgi:hypothetical protein